jgi:hypothetical protein
MKIDIEAAGRDFMQQGFPQVCRRPVDQNDLDAPAQLVAQAGGQFQSSSPSSYDDDAMSLLLFHWIIDSMLLRFSLTVL